MQEKNRLDEILALPKGLQGAAFTALADNPKIENLRAYVAEVLRREEKSCAFFSLHEDGLVQRVGEAVEEEIENWRLVEMGDEGERFLDQLREEGTAGIAGRLGVTQRRAQQKVVEFVESLAREGDFFLREVRHA